MLEPLRHRHGDGARSSLASRMQRRVACPVLGALEGNLPLKGDKAPSFDSICMAWKIISVITSQRGRISGLPEDDTR